MKRLTILLLALSLQSCLVVNTLGVTGFNRSRLITVAGSVYSIDRKFVHRISENGEYTRYAIDDPRVVAIVEASRMIERNVAVK